MPDTYDVDDDGHSTRNRLRSAAKRGDKRAEATLERLEQQRHTDRWQAEEQARADRAAERANRKRPGSVADVVAARQKEREEKAERNRLALEKLAKG